MANKKEHILYGAAAGAALSVLEAAISGKRLQPANIMICSLTAALGSAIPDFLEPPTHPNHRGMGHSLAMLLYLTAFLHQLRKSSNISPLASSAKGLIIGYGSHIAIDATTPARIPILF
jgi:membrane-bound metal-dependent hydrolase YbcI (DUF457 family)